MTTDTFTNVGCRGVVASDIAESVGSVQLVVDEAIATPGP